MKPFPSLSLPVVALVTKLIAAGAPAPVNRRKTKPFSLLFQQSPASPTSRQNVVIKKMCCRLWRNPVKRQSEMNESFPSTVLFEELLEVSG